MTLSSGFLRVLAASSVGLRLRLQTEWLRSLLSCPRAFTLVGDDELLRRLLRQPDVTLPLGVAIIEAESFRHEFLIPATPPLLSSAAAASPSSLSESTANVALDGDGSDATTSEWLMFWVRHRCLWWKQHGADSAFFNERVDADDSNQFNIVYSPRNDDDNDSADSVVETIRRKSASDELQHDDVGDSADAAENSGALLAASGSVRQGSSLAPTRFNRISSRVFVKSALSCLRRAASVDEQGAENAACRLHYRLTPYQVSVAVSSDRLLELARDVANELKYFGMSVLPVLGVGAAKSDSDRDACNDSAEDEQLTEAAIRRQLADADALGVYFNVVLNERTVVTGAVLLRCRDTGCAESIPLASVVDTVSCYLKTAAALGVPDVSAGEPPAKESKLLRELLASAAVRKGALLTAFEHAALSTGKHSTQLSTARSSRALRSTAAAAATAASISALRQPGQPVILKARTTKVLIKAAPKAAAKPTSQTQDSQSDHELFDLSMKR